MKSAMNFGTEEPRWEGKEISYAPSPYLFSLSQKSLESEDEGSQIQVRSGMLAGKGVGHEVLPLLP